MGRFEGSVAMVTGAGSGIGRGIAERLAHEGATVLVNDVDADAAALVAEAIGGAAAPADVSRGEELDRLFAGLDRIDALVNNAGLVDTRRDALDGDEAWFDEILGVNLRGVFSCAVRAARLMNDGGSIVNVSSVGAHRAHRRQVAYDASKGGIEAMTRALAIDLAPLGIRVNALAPGDIEARGRTPSEQRGAVVPLGRVGRPEDVAAVAAFLLSDDAAYVTGATIPVDGGLLAQLRPPALEG